MAKVRLWSRVALQIHHSGLRVWLVREDIVRRKWEQVRCARRSCVPVRLRDISYVDCGTQLTDKDVIVRFGDLLPNRILGFVANQKAIEHTLRSTYTHLV